MCERAVICVRACVCDKIFYFNLLNINFKTQIECNKNVSMTDKNLKIS